jgi:hypothetical protein
VLAGEITASPPLNTPTATPVPAADRPMTSALNAFDALRVGCLDAAALVLKISQSSAGASRRRGIGTSGGSTSLNSGTGTHGG